MDNIDRHIRHFVKIAELKSVSRAAEALDLTQSGISRQLAALEAYIGKPLFSRTGRGVILTRVGEKLFEAAKTSYDSIDEAVGAIREKDGLSEGQVVIAVVHTLRYYFMSEVVAEFMASRANVNLSLISRSSPDVVALVESGKADIGFVYDSAVDSAEFKSTPLFEDEMCLIARTDSGLPQEIDLKKTPCKLVGFPPHYALRRMLKTSGVNSEIATEAETVDAMLKLVSSGVGACVLPSRIPDRLLVDYGLRKIKIVEPALRRRVIAIVSASKQATPLVQDLLKIANDQAR